MKFKSNPTIGLIALCVMLVGCDAESQRSNSNQANSLQQISDADSHSHSKLSLHKPKTLSAASKRLRQMHESLIANEEFPAPVSIEYVEVIHGQGASGHSHFYSAAEYEANGGDEHDDEEHHEEDESIKHHTMEIGLRTELTDVIGWLPDLAAKSNLNETDWNSVESVSSRLTEITGAIASDASDASFRDSWKQKSNEIEVILDELQTHVDSPGATK